MKPGAWRMLAVGIGCVGLFVHGCSSDNASTPAPASNQGGSAGADGAAKEAGHEAGLEAGGTGGTHAKDAGDATPSGCAVKNLSLGGACDACGKLSCCNEYKACDADPTCVQLVECVNACPVDDAGLHHDPSCISLCAQPLMDATVPAGYNPLITCVGSIHCSDVCVL